MRIERPSIDHESSSTAGFVEETPRVGIWLDTTHLSPEETVDAILAQRRWQRTPIVITDYDTSWPTLFTQIAGPVAEALSDLGAIVEHVGSTAVAGLAAKPTVDIDVVVHKADDVPSVIERLRDLGYLYQGDKGVPGREAFLWPPGAPRPGAKYRSAPIWPAMGQQRAKTGGSGGLRRPRAKTSGRSTRP